MLRSIITVCLAFIWIISSGQDRIDYRPKSLVKELSKYDIQKAEKLEELPSSDSLAANNSMNGRFFLIPEGTGTGEIKYLYIGRVNSCRAGGCSMPGSPAADLDQEYFDYFILFDPDIRVRLVRVFNYQATHGQEVTVRGWLKQFIGYNGRESLQVGKDVDTISGATISVYAITEDVQAITGMLRKMSDTSWSLP